MAHYRGNNIFLEGHWFAPIPNPISPYSLRPSHVHSYTLPIVHSYYGNRMSMLNCSACIYLHQLIHPMKFQNCIQPFQKAPFTAVKNKNVTLSLNKNTFITIKKVFCLKTQEQLTWPCLCRKCRCFEAPDGQAAARGRLSDNAPCRWTWSRRSAEPSAQTQTHFLVATC